VEINDFIRGTQIIAERYEHVLEFVDPSKFTNFEKIEFSKNRTGFWEEGYVTGWNAKRNEWDRKGGIRVKLATHYCEKYLTSSFLRSVKC
jgi:hypothetical protein